MGVFDPNYKRLALLIMISLFLFIMYTGEAVLLSGQSESLHEYHYGGAGNLSYYESEVDTREEVSTIGDSLFGFLTFITFTIPEIPVWAKVFFAPVITIFLFIGVYLALDIAYDIIKALPFT